MTFLFDHALAHFVQNNDTILSHHFDIRLINEY